MRRKSKLGTMAGVNSYLANDAKRKVFINEVKTLAEQHGLNVQFGAFTFDDVNKEVRTKLTFVTPQKVSWIDLKVGANIRINKKNFRVMHRGEHRATIELRSKWGHDIPLEKPKLYTLERSKLSTYNILMVK